jgi:hypothetical protein
MSTTPSHGAAPPPYLTDAEIADICKPLKMAAARRRHLTRLGLVVKTKADGSPLVGRAEFERVMTGAAPARAAEPDATPGSTPNIVGLEQWALKRRQRGKKA